MAKKKSKKSSSKGKSKSSKDKKEESSQVEERTYAFPSLNKTVKAKNRSEAEKKVSE